MKKGNYELERLRKQCHDIFDKQWSCFEERCHCYSKLARLLNMKPEQCHFSKMNREYLKKALEILRGGKL